MKYLLSLHSNCKIMQEIKTISTYRQGLKERILSTAMNAFVAKGIRAVKMDDVAAGVGISKRTLYELYENKEDLLYEGLKAYHGQIEKRMKVIDESSRNVMEIILKVYLLKVEQFRTTNPLFYSDIVKYPKVLKFLEEGHYKMRHKSLEFLQRGVAEGFFRSDVNYELTSRLFDSLGRYVIAQQLYEKYSIEDIFNNLVFVTLRGFCTEKGVQALEKFR